MKIFPGFALGFAWAFFLSACSLKVENVSHKIPHVPSSLECLPDENTNGIAAIVNGSPVYKEDPDSKRAVLLGITRGDESFICTGVPITQRVILTAAHCVDGIEKTDVMAFFHPQLTCSSGFVRSKMSIESVDILIHEKYVSRYRGNDLALVKLKTPIPSDYKVPSLYEGAPLPSNDSILMVGYGITSENKEDSLVLRKVTKSFSREAWVRGPFLYFDQTKNSGGVCKGDSGGPIYAYVEGEPQLLGVTSAGQFESEEEYCHDESISMYVPAFKDWITESLLKIQQQ